MINLHTEMQFTITGTEEDIDRVISNDTLESIGAAATKSILGFKDTFDVFKKSSTSKNVPYSITTGAVMTVNVVPKTQPTQSKQPIPEKVVKEAVKAANEAAAKSKTKTTTTNATKTTPKK